MTRKTKLIRKPTIRWAHPLLAILIFLFIAGCASNLDEYDDTILDGVASLNMNNPEKALAKFIRAVDLDPKRADGYLGRANALNTLERYPEALADYNRAIAIDDQLANAYVNRGITNSHLGRIEAAVADYEKGLALDPEIDDPPGFVKRLFDNVPNKEKGIRKHLQVLKAELESRKINKHDETENRSSAGALANNAVSETSRY